MPQKENRNGNFTANVYRQLIARRQLGAALKLINSHPQASIVSGETAGIEADYRLMRHFLLLGYDDKHRTELYHRLLQRAYTATQQLALSDWLAQPYLRGYAIAVEGSTIDVDRMRQELQQFVQDITILQLDNGKDKDEQARKIYRAHLTLIHRLFIFVGLSGQWPRQCGRRMADLLCSPTIEDADACLLTSAITLGAANIADPEKLLALLSIYSNAPTMSLRQRALVGWMNALRDFPLDFFPEVKEALCNVLKQTDTATDVSELIVQTMFCLSTDKQSRQLHDEMMPHILKAQQELQDNGFGINLNDNSNLDDLLHPDKEEQHAEQLEKAIHHMMEMRDKGVDVYFKGFSQMKRFPFFSSIANWFMPFDIHHPELGQMPEQLLRSPFLQTIIADAPFCDSDKYSMVLGLSQVLEKMPENFRNSLLNAEIIGHDDSMDTASPTYLRRAYLHDLYRFFHINAAARDFHTLFDIEALCRVITHSTFKTIMGRQCSNLWRTLLNNGYTSEARILIDAYYDPTKENEVVGRALLSMKEGLYPQAEEEFARACSLRPDDMPLHAHYARACYLNGNYDKAADLFKKLSHVNPGNTRYALDYAVTLIHCGRTEEAMPTLFKLNYENPDNLNVQRALAWGSLLLHKIEQAAKIYQQLAALENSTAIDRLYAGYCAWMERRMTTALKFFRKSHLPQEVLARHFATDQKLLQSYGINDVEQAMMLDALAGHDDADDAGDSNDDR